MPNQSSASSPQVDDSKEVRLPSLFAIETHLIGWQGLSATTPVEWNLAQYAGNRVRGHLRVDDPDGPRLELLWEQPTKAVDLERSVDDFRNRLGRQPKNTQHE